MVFITLNGDASMTIFLDEENAYVDPGATALDSNGDRTIDILTTVTHSVQGVTGNVTSIDNRSLANSGAHGEGTYAITYYIGSDTVIRDVLLTDESIYTHSVQFDASAGTTDFDIVAFGDLSTNLTETFSFKDIFYQKGFDLNDISAVAYIDVSRGDFNDLFKLNIPLFDPSNGEADLTQVRYFTDVAGWADVSFSGADVSWNPIFKYHSVQTIQKDFTRSLMKDIMTNSRLNRLFANQSGVQTEVQDLDASFNEQIRTVLTYITNAGFLTDEDYGSLDAGQQSYAFNLDSTFNYSTRTDDHTDISAGREALAASSFSAFNPLRILSSSILGEDDADEGTYSADVSGEGLGNSARRDLLIEDLSGQVNTFWDDINNLKFYAVDSVDQSYCVWVTNTVDASNAGATEEDGVKFSRYLSGYKLYTEASNNIVPGDVSDLIVDVVDKKYDFEFNVGDRLHLLLKYSPASATFDLLSSNPTLHPRTYEVVMCMKD